MTRRQYSDPFGSDEEDETTPQDMNVINSTEEKKPQKTNFISHSVSVDVDLGRPKETDKSMEIEINENNGLKSPNNEITNRHQNVRIFVFKNVPFSFFRFKRFHFSHEKAANLSIVA